MIDLCRCENLPPNVHAAAFDFRPWLDAARSARRAAVTRFVAAKTGLDAANAELDAAKAGLDAANAELDAALQELQLLFQPQV